MKAVKTQEEAAAIQHDGMRTRAEAIIECLGSEYNPENEGWVVVVEQGDDPRNIDIGQKDPWNLLEVADESYWPFEEQIDKENGFWNMLILTNNEFGISFLIPDEPWLDPELRYRLEGGNPPFAV